LAWESRHPRLLSDSNSNSNTSSSRNGSSHESFSRGDEDMNAVKIAALALIVAGILGLVYGGFSYTKETHEAKLGPIELTVKDKETVNIPVWAGVGAIAIGGVLLLLGGRKS
jgi:hypothetical protein